MTASRPPSRGKARLRVVKSSASDLKSGENKIVNFPQTLEERLALLEREYQESIQELRKQVDQLKMERRQYKGEKRLKRELTKITKLLEKKSPLQNEIFPTGSISEKSLSVSTPRKAEPLKILTHYFHRLTSLKTYRRLIFGVTRLDREDFDEFGRDPAFEKKVQPFFQFLYDQYWRVSVEGLHHIPNTGPALIVANHSGTLPFDGSMIRMAVTNDHPSRRDVRFLVEDFVYYLPFVGTFMYRIGGVRASQENAERLLNHGHLVTVFPEGEKGIGKRYSHRYHLQRFGRGGFIKLALRAGVPIIPCTVIGAEETHPLLYRTHFLAKPFGVPYVPITPTLPWLGPLGLIGLPAKWSICFGKPIDLSIHGKSALNDELLIHRLSEDVRQTIQEMIREGLKKRRSIWFG